MINNLAESKYIGGYPTGETIQKLYDQLDLHLATQHYLEYMPAMLVQAKLDANLHDYGVSEAGGMICR